MTSTAWLSIRYRDFWDVPRIFIVENREGVFLFDCEFDHDSDEYPSAYVVSRLPRDATEAIDDNTDWRLLRNKGIRVGAVNVQDVKFDPTRRKFIDGSIFSKLN